MTKIRKRRWIGISLFFLAFSLISVFFLEGCKLKGKAGPEEKKASETIYLYNEKLTEAYKKENPELLQSVATRDEINRILKHLVFISSAHERMEYELKKLDYKEFKIEEKKAQVKTEETWLYKIFDKKTNKRKSSKLIRYRVTYNLVKQKGSWLVSGLKAKEL